MKIETECCVVCKEQNLCVKFEVGYAQWTFCLCGSCITRAMGLLAAHQTIGVHPAAYMTEADLRALL